MEPLIDICIPTCNSNSAFLRQAIESALAQTETRWHMYIHDDASQTDVASIIEPYLNDSRISWHPNQKKLGIGGNWNATMKLGNAPYIQFLFQDDWWEPHFLECGLSAMEKHPDVGIVSLGHTYVSEGRNDEIQPYKDLEAFRKTHCTPGRHDGTQILREWIQRQLHPNIIGEPDFIMLRRSVVERVGDYLEDMPQNLDMEYSARCLLQSNWYYVPETCGTFRVHPAAVSAVNQREGIGVFDRFRCFEELLKHIPAGPDRKLVINARDAALTDMAKKFLRRVGSGKHVTAKGGGAFRAFALRHPLLVTRALWKAFSAQRHDA